MLLFTTNTYIHVDICILQIIKYFVQCHVKVLLLTLPQPMLEFKVMFPMKVCNQLLYVCKIYSICICSGTLIF